MSLPLPTDPSTWAFLLPSYWLHRLTDEKPIPIEDPGYFEAPTRLIHTGFIHCSASDNPKHDDVEVVRRWHKGNGWRDIGYHYFISKEKGIQRGRSLRLLPAAQKGHNRGTVAICVAGRTDFTEEQMRNLVDLCQEIDREVGPLRWRGHCEVSRKSCPVFEYQKVLALDERGYMSTLLDAVDTAPLS